MAYALACFLGSILMFSLEPLLGKAVTPRFGGGAGVWVTCMLFFQATLLLGYLWAHGLSRLLAPRRQALVHGALLGATCLLLAGQGVVRLPFIPYWGALPHGPEGPGRLLALLMLSAGLPMVALSATAPLVQAWFATATPGRSPYRLYAASNIGSMAGLLCYPFLVERSLGLRAQVWVASGLFAVFFGLVAWLGRKLPEGPKPSAAPGAAPGWSLQGQWLLASAVGVMVLMGATNLLLFKVVAIPLLWVGPLALYLLTFVLVFEGRPFWEDPRTAFLWLTLFTFSLWFMATLGTAEQLKWALASHAAVLFGGLVCHGHLHRLRPRPEGLTRFYLVVALGGVLGGLAVAVVAPLVYTRNYEFGQAAVLTAVVGLLAMTGAPGRWRFWAWAPGLVALGTGCYLALAPLFQPGHYDRDFYGLVEVKESQGIRSFTNGGTVHGLIRLAEPLVPLTYYAPTCGAARALDVLRTRRPALRVGVIGMGIGTLGDYARPGDAWTFYEISPAVDRMAGRNSPFFPIIRSMPGRPEVVLGDGRMALELDRRAGRFHQFDLLVVDAFTNDRVPWHLLTEEALDLYLDQLAPDGIIALHISNPLPLHRVCLALARSRNLYGCIHMMLATPQHPRPPQVLMSVYVLLARRPDLLRLPAIAEGVQMGFGPRVFAGLVPESRIVLPLASDRPWTDERSALSDLLFNRAR